MKHFVVVIEPSATGYAAFSPDVPGCVATGKTVEKTVAKMRSALVFHFEGMAEAGEPLPEPRGFDHYVRSDEHIAEAGDLLTTVSADLQRPITVLAGIVRGERAVADGRTITHDEAKARLGRWLE